MLPLFLSSLAGDAARYLLNKSNLTKGQLYHIWWVLHACVLQLCMHCALR